MPLHNQNCPTLAAARPTLRPLASKPSVSAEAAATSQVHPVGKRLESLEAVEADDAIPTGDDNMNTTSITPTIYRGNMEHGRRWQTVREGKYWGPSDEKQLQSMEAAHLTYLILEYPCSNLLFRSPLPETAKNILDLGTGNGAWAPDVADRWPEAMVVGIDLYPPPMEWVPPNCRLEVDDMLKKWVFPENVKWDLVHIRDLQAFFTDEQLRLACKQAYNNLAPGGWYEEVETEITFYSDDGSLPPDSLLAPWGDLSTHMLAATGKKIDTINTMNTRIEAAGFTT